MVDPSLLLSEEGLGWFEEDAMVGQGIVISRVFAQWLMDERDLNIELLLTRADLGVIADRRSRLAEIVGGLQNLNTFSYTEADLVDDAVQAVLARMIERGDAIGELRADEWAFLQSSSILGSKLKRPIRAFRNAGAAVLEFGREVGLELLAEVIPREHIPQILTTEVIARGVVKWIALGGATIGGGSLGGLIGGPFGAELGKEASKFLAKSAVVAIDP